MKVHGSHELDDYPAHISHQLRTAGSGLFQAECLHLGAQDVFVRVQASSSHARLQGQVLPYLAEGQLRGDYELDRKIFATRYLSLQPHPLLPLLRARKYLLSRYFLVKYEIVKEIL